MPVEIQLKMIANNLKPEEYNAYYNRYLKKIPGNLELGILLLETREEFLRFLGISCTILGVSWKCLRNSPNVREILRNL